MQLILKQVRIIDPTSPHHNSVKDILIKDGRIDAIRNRIAGKYRTFESEGACVSPGWLDLGAFSGEPGLEHIEDFKTLGQAALRGGYTAVAVMPNTQPVIHSQSEVGFIRTQSDLSPIHFIPLGSITRDAGGIELAEMLDMHAAGACAFTDGLESVQRVGVMQRALEYCKAIPSLVINRPHQRDLAPEGTIHEGPTSVSLGLRGISKLAETMMIKRDIDLLRYTESRLLVSLVSCAESVALIRSAKKEGLQLYASVAAMNLVETETALEGFNVNFKVEPPLRLESDRLALLGGVLDGTIDVISSNHRPVEPEHKKLEFPYADFGAIGLETTFSLLLTAFGKRRKLDYVAQCLSANPRRLLGLQPLTIQKDSPADLTLFSTSGTTLPNPLMRGSKSANSPYFNENLPGRVLGAITKGRFHEVQT